MAPRSRVAWELWALALLGLWLHFVHDAPATTAGAHPGVGAALWAGVWAALPWVGTALVAGALATLAVSAVRLVMRRRRVEAMIAEEIVLGPDDVAQPAEVVAALDAIHTALLTRYGGPALGQVSWSFEIIRDLAGQIHFVIAAPHRWLTAIEDIWRGVYTNLRFQPWGDQDRVWPYAQQLVLARPWWYPTRVDAAYDSSVVELIVQALDRATGEARLQWLLTPVPMGPLWGRLKGSLAAMEQAALAAGTPAVGRQELGAVAALWGRSAFRAEVRLAADTWDTVQRVFGAVAASNAANQWRATTVWAFRGLWSRWLAHRVPSVGLFGHTLLFSKPLATVLHVPSARLRVQSLSRMLVRRGPAPPTIPRDPALAILKDEIGPVGIPEGDRKFNTLFIGSQGGGKSTGLLQQIRVDAAWRDRQGRPKALVVIDIGKDTAQRALGLIPPDRDVLWFDPTDPACPWTLNPLQAGVDENALANDVLEGLTQVFGDDAIRARSREFLGNAILAVKDVWDDQADFIGVYRMLTDAGFRQDVIDRVRDPHQQAYWQVTFTQTVANNPRFLDEGLAAPRNKLDEVLRTPAVRAALTTGGGRQLLDLHQVVQGRQVLIANLDKAKLGKSGARLLGVFLITLLWHALQSQTDRPEAERVPTALILDEAQNFISDNFLDLLAEGRAYGAQTTLAVRFLGEILSERAILGVRTLVQNLIIYQFELREDAEDFMKRFMRTYSNMVSPSDEAQDNINFGADDFMRLPKHHVVCRWMVDGSPQPAFLAETLPWEPAYHEAWRAHHAARQPRVTAAAAAAPAGVDREPAPAPLAPDPGPAADLTLAVPPPASALAPEPAPAVPAPAEDSPPPWLGWLLHPAPPETWWEAATGAALAPVWAVLAGRGGQGWVWQLEGIPVTPDRPAWAEDRRRAAVTLARSLAGPDAVLVWLAPDLLGVWGPVNAAWDEAAWIEAGAAADLVWTRVPPPVEAAAPPTDARTPPHDPEAEATARAALWATLQDHTGITSADLARWQRAWHATDAEVEAAVRWVLSRHIDRRRAPAVLQTLLQKKREDRVLRPACAQLKCSPKEFMDVVPDGSAWPFWLEWLQAHPDVQTLKAFRAAVEAQRGNEAGEAPA